MAEKKAWTAGSNSVTDWPSTRQPFGGILDSSKDIEDDRDIFTTFL
jgi:hypothetical protein